LLASAPLVPRTTSTVYGWKGAHSPSSNSASEIEIEASKTVARGRATL
jgi:hypothetical protein